MLIIIGGIKTTVLLKIKREHMQRHGTLEKQLIAKHVNVDLNQKEEKRTLYATGVYPN
jgi:hypothetical protein